MGPKRGARSAERASGKKRGVEAPQQGANQTADRVACGERKCARTRGWVTGRRGRGSGQWTARERGMPFEERRRRKIGRHDRGKVRPTRGGEQRRYQQERRRPRRDLPSRKTAAEPAAATGKQPALGPATVCLMARMRASAYLSWSRDTRGPATIATWATKERGGPDRPTDRGPHHTRRRPTARRRRA